MRNLISIAILCLVPLTSGCLAAAGLTVGAAGVIGYVYYDKNEATRDFQASFDKTWKATLEALERLDYTVPLQPEHTKDAGDLRLGDTRVRVTRQPGNVTRVSIRIGTFDCQEHRRRAGLILETIEHEL